MFSAAHQPLSLWIMGNQEKLNCEFVKLCSRLNVKFYKHIKT